VVINNVQIFRLDADSVKLCWDSNIETKGNVNYDDGNNQNNNISEQDYALTDHCLTLNNIPESGDYHYRITATSNATKSGTFDGQINGNSISDLPQTGGGPKSLAQQLSDAPAAIIALSSALLTNSISLLNSSTQAAPVFALPLTGAVAAAATFSYPQFFAYGLLWFKRGKKQNPWGVVYDSARKPLAFATVRALLPAVGLSFANQKIIKEVITDTQGKYALGLPKGDYNLQALYPGLPSKELPLKVAIDGEYISADIQLDKNVQAGFINGARKLLSANLGRLSWAISIAAFLYTIYAVIVNPNIINILLIVFYIFQLGLLYWFGIKHAWGKVSDARTGKPVGGAFVRVYDVKEGRQVNVIMTDQAGRYGFIQNEGDYYLRVDIPGYTFPPKNAKAGEYLKLPSGIDVLPVHLKKNQLISLNLTLEKT
jgi:hypothetical protein